MAFWGPTLKLLHFIGQSKSRGQPWFKGQENGLHLWWEQLQSHIIKDIQGRVRIEADLLQVEYINKDELEGMLSGGKRGKGRAAGWGGPYLSPATWPQTSHVMLLIIGFHLPKMVEKIWWDNTHWITLLIINLNTCVYWCCYFIQDLETFPAVPVIDRVWTVLTENVKIPINNIFLTLLQVWILFDASWEPEKVLQGI